MYNCDEARNLLEDALAGALDSDQRAALDEHLAYCGACRLHLAEAKLATALLRDAAAPAPPETLAAQISSAAHTYLRFQKRPMHQKALGSPAFLATCASLLCGAAICLLAIMRVAAVPGSDRHGAVSPGLVRTVGAHAMDLPGALHGPGSRLVATTSPDGRAAPRAIVRSRPGSWVTSLPGGSAPPSLVAIYPRRPRLENISVVGRRFSAEPLPVQPPTND
jgi:anti-sigma factor RsiW